MLPKPGQRMYALLVLLGLVLAVVPTHTPEIQAQENCRTFPETGYTLRGRFLDFWQSSGGLSVHGLPISNEMSGNVGTWSGKVQVMERSIFQYFPQNVPPYDVQLVHLGRKLLEGQSNKAPQQRIGNPNSEGVAYYPETGHTLRGAFLSYWQNNGGLQVFGLPLTEEFTEGQFTVQYFERSRFEWHPENEEPFKVLLGHLGKELRGLYTQLPGQPVGCDGTTAAPISPAAPTAKPAHHYENMIEGSPKMINGHSFLFEGWREEYAAYPQLLVDGERVGPGEWKFPNDGNHGQYYAYGVTIYARREWYDGMYQPGASASWYE